MNVKIGAFGYGLAAILGTGAIILAGLNNPSWKTFLGIAVFLWIVSVILRRI